tara:strand:- start:197 stop:394 length:198 start_codon:yes stop_codon:yes gene_type:complete
MDRTVLIQASYKILFENSRKIGLRCPIEQRQDEFIVSPRIPLIVESYQIDAIIKKGEELGVEIGR